jgi:hypothetical protein
VQAGDPHISQLGSIGPARQADHCACSAVSASGLRPRLSIAWCHQKNLSASQTAERALR